MLQSWPGRYLDGTTAHAESVTVVPAAHGLEIRRSNGSTVVWPYVEVTQTQGNYHGEHVRLERGTEPIEALIVDDAAVLSQLHKVAPRVSQHFHDPKSRARRPALVVMALAAAVAAGLGIYFWGIPAAATFAAAQIPVSWEEQLGEVVTRSLVESEKKCANPQVTNAVSDIVARLAATVPDNPYTFRVSVIRNDVMNAFAAPGGHIVVFSGLLRRTDRAEELAGVLAHEMSHVVRRHGTKSLFREVSNSIFLSAIVGDASGAMRVVLDSAKTLGSLHYGRKAEAEADLDGLSMLVGARIDPAGMVSFFEKLEKKELGVNRELLKYLSTHPLTSDRIAVLKAEPSTKSGPFMALPQNAAWKTLALACNPKEEDEVEN